MEQQTMTLIELGALGEFLGSMAVLATLVYLSVQLRQNTRTIQASEKLALAQTYQMRADALQLMTVQAADSDYLGPIITKLTSAGYPEDISSLDTLSEEELGRFRLWQIAQQTHWDNMLYQYQQGFIDEEYYQHSFKTRVHRLAPTWEALGVNLGARGSFNEEMRRVTEELQREQQDKADSESD